MNKELYLREAYAAIPHIIGLLDRSPVSPTYGCFDRNFWHYKAIDFPSGMYEELILPLALLFHYDLPNNPYYQIPRIKEYVIAGIRFGMGKTHRNGSCDDYYPNEQALGATVFSLYAATESYLLLGMDDPDMREFFITRARFIMRTKESGTLANHHAIAAIALLNVARITGDDQWEKAAEEKLREVLSYQSPEGWFSEYGGCDPGYLTFTISFLARALKKKPNDSRLAAALERAVDFCFWTVHPDGSYGGEYGSRNTFHTLSAGFEMLASHFQKATFVRTKFLEGIATGTRARTDDDRIFGHAVYDLIEAYLAHNTEVRSEERSQEYAKDFPEAGLVVRATPESFLICSARKGGVFKWFQYGKLTASDAGIVLRTTNQTLTLQGMLVPTAFQIGPDRIIAEGVFQTQKTLLPTPAKQILFRLFTLTVGRFASRPVRILLQKLLITFHRPSVFHFTRTLTVDAHGIQLTDNITAPPASARMVTNLWIATDYTPIYVATSQPSQSGSLLSWQAFPQNMRELQNKGHTVIQRTFSA